MGKKIALKIETKVDGKPVKLELIEEEVLTGHSICERGNLKSITVMKKHNGGALFFTNEANAANVQQRHGFDYAFDIKAGDFKAEAAKILAAKKAAADKAAADKNKG